MFGYRKDDKGQDNNERDKRPGGGERRRRRREQEDPEPEPSQEPGAPVEPGGEQRVLVVGSGSGSGLSEEQGPASNLG